MTKRKITVKASGFKKLIPVKVLEKRVWLLCKELTRKTYGYTCYTCGKENLTPFQCHTGHFRKKSLMPMQMKYDLRILRPQCPQCNLFQDGNEGAYATQLIRDHGAGYVLQIDDDIKYFKQNLFGATESREFLQNLIAEYKGLLAKS